MVFTITPPQKKKKKNTKLATSATTEQHHGVDGSKLAAVVSLLEVVPGSFSENPIPLN